MRFYKPASGNGVRWGIILMIVTGLIILVPMIISIFSGNVMWPFILLMVFLFCCLTGMFAYFTWTAKNMEYGIDDKEILIKWGLSKKRIPLSSVENVSVVMGSSVLKVVGVSWPGFHLGSFTSPTGKGMVNLYATRVMGDIVIVKTKWESIGITPEDSDEFLEKLECYIPDMDKRSSAAAANQENPFQAWKDKRFLLLTGIAVLILAGTGIYLSQVIPTLPSKVPMHFNLQGQVDRYGSPTEVYMPFGIGVAIVLMMLGINSISARNNKVSAYMIATVSIFIAALFSLIAVVMTLTAG